MNRTSAARTTELIQAVMDKCLIPSADTPAPHGGKTDPRQTNRRYIQAMAAWIEVDERLAHLEQMLIDGYKDNSINDAIDAACRELHHAARMYKAAGITTVRKPRGV